jgi:hypothetical protein
VIVMAAMATDDSGRAGPGLALVEGPADTREKHDGEFDDDDDDGRFDEPAAASRVALAWNPRRKVRMSDIELSGPKTIMKVRMDRRFQARGRSSCPGSALPGQQPDSAGAGDMRLLRQEGQHPRRTP